MVACTAQSAARSRGAAARRQPPVQQQLRLMAGDWHCTGCGDHQFARNTQCRWCGALRPPDATLSAAHIAGKGLPRVSTKPRVRRKRGSSNAEEHGSPGMSSACEDSLPGLDQPSAFLLPPSEDLEDPSISDSSPVMDIPPWLDTSHMVSPQQASEKASASNWSTGATGVRLPAMTDLSTPQGYQVLLRNFPDLWMRDFLICQMLQEAELDGGLVGITSRPGGKVLIGFSSFDSVKPCIDLFDGQQVGGSEVPIGALYVRTITRVGETTPVPLPSVLSSQRCRVMSHVGYAPGYWATSTNIELSATAAVFVPSSSSAVSTETDDDKEDHIRAYSDADASTGTLSSQMSEDTGSENEKSSIP